MLAPVTADQREPAFWHKLLAQHILVLPLVQHTRSGCARKICGIACTRYSTPFSVARRAAMPIRRCPGWMPTF